jgi:hypothetical protein
MTLRRRETFPPVTLGHIRGHGCHNLLVYCTSGWCHHSAVTPPQPRAAAPRGWRSFRSTVNYLTLERRKIWEPYFAKLNAANAEEMQMRIGIGIAVVVAIGLIWSIAAMSEWVPVASAG